MERRHFMRALAAAPALGAAAAASAAPPAGDERAYLLRLLQRMAEPVLGLMSKGEPKKIPSRSS